MMTGDRWKDDGITYIDYEGDSCWNICPPSARLSLMVGPTCAGKSTWINSGAGEAYGVYPDHAVSSDCIRRDVYGTPHNQSNPRRIFRIVYELANARLKRGLPVIIDATHLLRRYRVQTALQFRLEQPVTYFVIDRPLEIKRRDAGWRAAAEKDIIGIQHSIFQQQLPEILSGDGLSRVRVVNLIQG